jgi:hypothetical protein
VQVFWNVLSASGRDPASFAVEMDPDGQVHVTGPRGSAFYAAGTWLSRFSRHLEKGYFDPASQQPATRIRPPD